MADDATPSARTYLGWAVQILGALALVAAAALFLFHLYSWFASGGWPGYSGARLIADFGLPYPAPSWVVLRRVIDWTLAWSAAGLLVGAALVVWYLGTVLTYPYDHLVAAAEKRRQTGEPAPLPVMDGEPTVGARVGRGIDTLGCIAVIVAGLIGVGLAWTYWGGGSAPPPSPVAQGPSTPITTADWLWPVGLGLTVVVSLVLIRRWTYNIRIAFDFGGKAYTRYRDGRFTDEAGATVVDPALLAKLEAPAEAAKKERFRRMDRRGAGF